MLDANDVADAVTAHLRQRGWSVIRDQPDGLADATREVVATCGEEVMRVVVRGAASAVGALGKHRRPLGSMAVGAGVADSLYRAAVVSGGLERAAIALPDDELHRRDVDPLRPALTTLGILLLLVDVDGNVVEQ